MSFQQILNGPRPTTSQQAPRQASTSGIDALNTGVKLATQAIGSSYAEAQVEGDYENAFAAYNKSREAVDGLKDNLSGLTRRYNTGDRPKGLIDQMTALEKTIRQAEMGEAAGKLSGLSVKARVDSAYKTALNRFPAFAAELRSHKDAATSGGGIGSAIQQSQINQEIAVAQSKEMASAMAKYGLDYFNPEDQHQFNNEERIMGEITRKNEYIKGVMEPSILRMDFETKRVALDSADLKFEHYKEDRDGAVVDKEISRAQAIENYNHSLIEHANSITDRPGEISQKDATLRKTRADAARTERGNRDAISSREIATQAGKYLGQVYGMTSQEIFNGTGKDLPVEKQLEILETNYAAVRGEVHKMFLANGQLGGAEYTRTMSQLDNDMSSTKSNIESGDPVKIQERLNKFLELKKSYGKLTDPNLPMREMLQNPGVLSIFTEVNKLVGKAAGQNTPTEKSNTLNQAQAYLEATTLSGIIPEQLAKDMLASIKLGRPTGNKDAVIGAAALGVKGSRDMSVDDQNSESQRKINKLAQDSKYGLEVMADWGGLAHARASSENASQYRTAHDKWFGETVRLLPDGHGIEWKDGKYHITKDDGQSVAVFDHNAVNQPKFSDFGTQRHTGFDKWPFDSSTNLQDLTGQLKDHAWIMENASDLNLTSSLMRDPADKQNVGVVGEALNVANAVGDFFDSAVDSLDATISSSRQAVGIDVNTKFLTEKYDTPKFNNTLVEAWNARGKEYVEVFNDAAAKTGYPMDVLVRQVGQESSFNDKAISTTKKHLGLGQFSAAMGRKFGLTINDKVDDRLDGTKSIYAVANFMKHLTEKYNGDVKLALVDYNGGPRAVAAWKAGKPFKESVGYIERIIGG